MIVLIGFGPFKNNETNLSSEVVQNFPSHANNFRINKEILPVSWKNAIKLYKNLLKAIKIAPKLVMLLGIHTGSNLHLEKFSWNLKYGIDNENNFKLGIIKYFFPFRIKTVLNLSKIYSSLKNKINLSISTFPGLYLCNYLYYWALFLSDQEYPVIFVHIPANGDVYEYTKIIKLILKMVIKLHLSN